MEVLTGDRKILNPEDEEEEEFPTHISPFSETADITLQLLLANPTAAMLQSTTPRKLRIRCNGRPPSVDAAADSGQLGSGAAGDNGLSPDNDDGHLNAQGGGEFIKWKRKRKRTPSSTRRRSKRVERLELFLESLVNKMMEKQEQMHKELIEMVQEREKERIAKEEAWKQHELERITRDEEIRAQETSRSLALINFVQNLLGTEVQVPPLAPLVAQPVATLPPTSNHNQQCIEENNHLHKEIIKCDPTPTDKRWLQAEVQALIALRASLEHKFRTPANSGHGSVWEEIALGMNGMGFDRTGRKCKEKWENINKYFKRAITSDKKRSANAKTCQYFNDLELLYNSGLLNLGNASSQTSNLGNGFSCTSNQNETKSESESQHCVLSKVDTSLLTCATIPRVVVSPAL